MNKKSLNYRIPFTLLFFCFIALLFSSFLTFSPTIVSAEDFTYQPLSSIPETTEMVTIKDPETGETRQVEAVTSLGTYLKSLFYVVIGIAGVLALLMLVIGGAQYMMSDVVTKKGEATEQMTNAVIGLVLAMFSWLILNTINPELVNFSLNPEKITIYDQSTPPGDTIACKIERSVEGSTDPLTLYVTGNFQTLAECVEKTDCSSGCENASACPFNSSSQNNLENHLAQILEKIGLATLLRADNIGLNPEEVGSGYCFKTKITTYSQNQPISEGKYFDTKGFCTIGSNLCLYQTGPGWYYKHAKDTYTRNTVGQTISGPFDSKTTCNQSKSTNTDDLIGECYDVPWGKNDEILNKMLTKEQEVRTSLVGILRVTTSDNTDAVCNYIGDGTDSGTNACSNVGGLHVSTITKLDKLKKECEKWSTANLGEPCNIELTAGTEWWHHGNKQKDLFNFAAETENLTKHKPSQFNPAYGRAVDLRMYVFRAPVTTETVLTKFIKANKKDGFPETSSIGPKYQIKNVSGNYYEESSPAHWHVSF